MSLSADKEQFYDEVIAPQLAEIAKSCEARGLSFLAFCEYEAGSYGHTSQIQPEPESSFAIRLIDAAGQARGNIDGLFFAVYRWAEKRGRIGESLVLKMLDQLGEAESDE